MTKKSYRTKVVNRMVDEALTSLNHYSMVIERIPQAKLNRWKLRTKKMFFEALTEAYHAGDRSSAEHAKGLF
jgi:hypothetical protein